MKEILLELHRHALHQMWSLLDSVKMTKYTCTCMFLDVVC